MNSGDPSPRENSASGARRREAVPAKGSQQSPAWQHHEKLYHLLFELMPSSLLLLDARGIVLDANPSFCRQIGYARAELLGLHIGRFSQESPEAIERNIARLMAGEVLEHEVTNVRKDGSPRHYELRETAINLPDGSRGILAIANDITLRVRAEQAKLEMEQHLLQTEKFKSLGLMAGGIAHDFNNLLGAILGNLELAALDLEKNSPVHTNLSDAIAATHRAADLTRQMLAYSGRGRFVVKELDLNEQIRDLSELLKATISKMASLELRLAPDLAFIEADATQLQEVVMNLATNASEALGERPGLITITTSMRDCDANFLARSRGTDHPAPGRYVVLEVRDTGCGMDESVQARLFDPFFTTKFMGRGLGLSAVLGVVRGHRGAIMISSQIGTGTSISVLFPACAVRPVPKARPTQAPPTPETVSPSALAGTVLVVDDEPPMRLLMERVLKRTGLRVLTAGDGEAAVALFREHAAEILFVLLDLTMPKMDGLKTLAELRRIQPEVKAILTSGYDVESINQRYAHEGFAAFIRKPFEVESLISLAWQMCADAT